MRIAEVLQAVPVTLLPTAPGFVEGIIELRGRFLPVIDLRRRFGELEPRDRALGKYVVAPVGQGEEQGAVAFVVDEVTGVERIPLELIQPAPAVGGGAVAPIFVSGVIRWNDRVLMLLDIDRILSPDEWSSIRSP